MEIDESKLFSPIVPMFLEGHENGFKRLTMILIGMGNESRREKDRTFL
jgi:hypothetical protein